MRLFQVNISSICTESHISCQSKAVKTLFIVLKGYLVALYETEPSCVLFAICKSSANASAEGILGVLAATLAR